MESRRISTLAVALAFLVATGLSAVAARPVAASTTFVVNRIGDQPDLNLANASCDVSTNAGSQCTLRAAIQEANDTPGADTINFNITTTSKTITPATPLPAIAEQLTVDGYSQPGSSENTKAASSNAILVIILNGLNAGAGSRGLAVDANGSTIRGLVIQRFDTAGIEVNGNENTVAGNFIGTDVTGTLARGNSVGVRVTGAANVIGGTARADRNLISGNSGDGILVSGDDAADNQIWNNFIGTKKSGNSALGNGFNGVTVENAPRTLIGDGLEAGRNVISGNAQAGVRITDSGALNRSSVLGNYIGTNAVGTQDLGNVFDGVSIASSDITVGGDEAGERNVISGNGIHGLRISSSMRVDVLGNYIGTNAAGTAALGNDGSGIYAQTGGNHRIGGPGEGNVISANDDSGIVLHATTAGNIIEANKIGTRADGTGALGNGGVGVVFIGSTFTSLGGADSGEGNVISGNGDSGVLLSGPSTGNTIAGNAITSNGQDGINAQRGPNRISGNLVTANANRGIRVTSSSVGVDLVDNQIFGNAQLEIDLVGGTQNGFGVTANDNDDPDTGANNLQNFPVLTGAVRSSATNVATISGTLNSTPSRVFRIDLFRAAADNANHGGALELLGSQNISTDAGGNKAFTFQLGGLATNDVVTVTATALATDSTSEFSANRTVVTGP